MEDYESAAPVQRGSRSPGKKRETVPESPRLRQSIRPVQMAPGMPGEVRPAEGGYYPPGQSPSDLHRQFKSSSESLKKAMSSGEKDRISEQLYGIRHEAQTLRGRLRTLPLEQRLHVPSISIMYDEGTRLVEEGMRTNQQSKIRMGLEKIEDANRRLGELEKH